METKTTDEVKAEVDAQPVLEPGTEGWWRVWGASPHSIEPGDYVLCKDGDGVDEFYVQSTYKPKSYPMTFGIVVDGREMTIGALAGPLVILRRGTKNTLAR